MKKSTEVSISTKSDTIGPADKLIVAALSTKKISDCSPRELDIHVVQSVHNAFKFVGKRETETLSEELSFILQTLPGELRTYLPGMRAGEIPIAIKRGLLKEFGDYFGINVAELLRFCKTHYDSPERSNSVKAIKEEVVPQLAPGKEDIFKLYKNNLLDAFEKMKVGANFEVNAPSLYDFCDKLGLIVFTPNEKYEFLAEAAQVVIRDQQLKLSIIVEDYHRKPLNRIIDVIKECVEKETPLPEDIAVVVKAKAKFLTLKAFLQSVEVDEVDLAETVQNKKEFYIQNSLNK